MFFNIYLTYFYFKYVFFMYFKWISFKQQKGDVFFSSLWYFYMCHGINIYFSIFRKFGFMCTMELSISCMQRDFFLFSVVSFICFILSSLAIIVSDSVPFIDCMYHSKSDYHSIYSLYIDQVWRKSIFILYNISKYEGLKYICSTHFNPNMCHHGQIFSALLFWVYTTNISVLCSHRFVGLHIHIDISWIFKSEAQIKYIGKIFTKLNQPPVSYFLSSLAFPYIYNFCSLFLICQLIFTFQNVYYSWPSWCQENSFEF